MIIDIASVVRLKDPAKRGAGTSSIIMFSLPACS